MVAATESKVRKPKSCHWAIAHNLPSVDLEKDKRLWAVLDTACNNTVCGEEWLQKAWDRWQECGLAPIFDGRITGTYGGLAGAACARTIGKVSFPFLIMSEGEKPDRNMPVCFNARMNCVQGDANLLLGLDLMRVLNIRVDVVSNVCTR